MREQLDSLINVQNAMIKIPAYPGTFGLTALINWAPTIMLAAAHPTQASTLKIATNQRRERREKLAKSTG
jgi:hypothetical protein